jgi:hypothetical protein
MNKKTRRRAVLVLGALMLCFFLVSCVSFEKMGKGVDDKLGWNKEKKEAAPDASQAEQQGEGQEKADSQASPGETQPAATTTGTTTPMSATKQSPDQYFIHQVKWPNESLSIIAKWYTGSVMNWKALAEANPEMEPTVIHLGDRIRIPAHMLKTRDPMPEAFVQELIESLKSKGSSKGKEEEPALFGPKGAEKE